MQKFSKLILIVLLVLVVLGFTGCSSQKEGELQEVTIMLDWYPNAVHAGLYVALEKGYFSEEDFAVSIQMPAETGDPLKLVAAGQIDFAISYQPQVVMARANEIPVVSVASLVGHPLNTLMVADESIKSPRDFVGKTIGYSLPVYEAIAKTAIVNDGGDLGQVNLVDIGWDLMPALATNRVEGISGGFINHEKILLEKEGLNIKTIDPREYGVPDYYELILVTNEKMLENKELIAKFWRALAKGQSFVVENPIEGLNILLENQNEQFPLDVQVEKESLEILLPLMDDFGRQSLDRWQEVIDWMYELELITKKPDAEKAFMEIGN